MPSSTSALKRAGLATFLTYIASAVSIPLAPSAPQSITILDTKVTGCDVASSVKVSADRLKLNILYDTTKANGSQPQSLAWTDSVGATENNCVVCTKFKWSDKLYGYITGLEYDFEHRLDYGLLEQVATYIYRESGATDGDEYFDYSWIYGDDGTQVTSHVHTNQQNDTAPLLLDFAKASESLCIQTAFRVYNRVGVMNATGEISKRSVFTQSLDIVWQTTNTTLRRF